MQMQMGFCIDVQRKEMNVLGFWNKAYGYCAHVGLRGMVYNISHDVCDLNTEV